MKDSKLIEHPFKNRKCRWSLFLLSLIVLEAVVVVSVSLGKSFSITSFSEQNEEKDASINKRMEEEKKEYNPLFDQPLESSTRIPFDVIDLRNMSLTFAQTLVIVSIEGLVNRYNPNLFLVYDDVNRKWLDYINTTRYEGIVIENIDFSQIIERYKEYYGSIILLNSSSTDEVNLASPLAGVYSALLIDHALYQELQATVLKDMPIALNITEELAPYPTRVERYEYAKEHYYPLCNHSAFAIFDGCHAGYMRSFIIANQLFTFWAVNYIGSEENTEGNDGLIKDSPEELAFFENFLNSTPGNIPIYGYFYPIGDNEAACIERISRSNKYLIPMDFFSNLPFYNAMKLPEDYQFKQYRPSQYRKLSNKIYITGIWSDGDNLQYIYNKMMPSLWNSDTVPRGEVPTGWTINPSLIHLAPYVIKYFYDTATENDYFVGALSGKGYCKMDYFSNTTIRSQFLRESQSLWDKLDIREARIWDLDESAESVVENVNLTGIFDGYLGPLQYTDPLIVDDVPIIRSEGFPGDSDDVYTYVTNMDANDLRRPRFIFIHILCWTITTEEWTELAKKLDAIEGVEVVRPDEFTNLISQWNKSIFAKYFLSPKGILLFLAGSSIALISLLVIIQFFRKRKKNAFHRVSQ